ncbi:universal stress protein, partial [Corynebacterium pyruviciproducens]
MSQEQLIVCAVDGSEAAEVAVAWAANTANKRDCPLQLVSSYSMPQFLYA